jgi:WD40 repeat protein
MDSEDEGAYLARMQWFLAKIKGVTQLRTILRQIIYLFSLLLFAVNSKQEVQLDGLRPVRAFTLAFSSDGQMLAASENRGAIKIWNLSEAKVVRTIAQSSGVWSMAFNRQGTQLAAGGDGFVQLWDASSGNEINSRPSRGSRRPTELRLRQVAQSASA